MAAVWLVMLAAGGLSRAGELQDKPGGALSLQVAFDKGAKAAFGPAPVRQSLGEAVWKAGDILNNAQGAVSFRIRIPKHENPPQQPWPLMSLSGTQAGEWTLLVNEAPEPKPTGKPKPPDQLPEPEAGPLGGEAALKADLDDGKKDPVGQFTCEVRTKIFAEGNITGKTTATAKVFEWGQWHQVIWTWRSVHHFIFIDGKLRGTSLQVSRMQPMASPEAILRVALGKAELADLRLYKRALDPPDAAALSNARPDQHLLPFPPLRVWADWGPATGRAVVYLDAAAQPVTWAEFRCLEVKSGKVLVDRLPIHDFPSGFGERAIVLAEPERIPAGTCRFEAIAHGADGKEIARSTSAEWTCPELKYPWLGTRAGLPEKPTVLPPYTPIEVKGDTIRTLLRGHTLDQMGLFKSIVAGDAELLAGPVRMEITSAGRRIDFHPEPGTFGIMSESTSAGWKARSKSPEGVRLSVYGGMQIDGLATVKVMLSEGGKLVVDRAALVIPFRPEVMQRFHCVASGFINRFMAVEKDKDGRFRARNICWDTYSPKEPKRREGVIYDANDVHHMDNVDRFRFVPFVHVGNNERGLAWFAENDQGWVHDPGNVPPMEIVATEKERLLRLNIVAKPTTITEKEPLSFRFFLLANPFKPMPKDWRTWIVADYRKDTEFARKAPYRFWWHWSEYARSFVPYPGGVQGKTYQDWVGKFKGDDLIHCPFINFGVPADSGLYGPPFFNEMAVLPYSWKLHNSRPHQDYVAYWLDKCAKEIGIKGVYVDEPYCEPYSYNVLAGDAPYIRPDGTRAVGYRWLEARDYFRRIKQTFHDLGLPYSLWVHTTNYKASPALTFVDISMDGEHPMIWVPSFQDYHIFYNAQRSRGYISGIPFGFVGTQMFHGNTEPKTFPGLWVKSRTYLAVTLPNQVLPQTCGIPDELDRIHNLWHWFGIGDEGVDEVSQPFGGVVNRKKGQALLYATAPWKGSRIELPDGFKGLDFGEPHIHAWNAETGASLVVDGKPLVDLAMPNDVAVIFARAADKPQPSRPEGVLMGASFDSGIEPDFGGGLVPASGACDASAKALAAGFDKPPASYPVVPSWVQGTIEFDLTLKSPSQIPLRLLALRHHLDLTLSAAQKGLVLATNEVPPQDKLPYPSGKLPTQRREAFVPVPIGERGRVAIVWRSGQYDLYWNGKRLGGISAPAAPRLRDAAAPAMGVVLGDGSGAKGQAEAVIDSLLVYDWALQPEDMAGRGAMVSAKRPPRGAGFDVRAWGEKLNELTVGIHMAEFKDWEKVTSVKFTVFDAKAPASPLGTAELVPWLGTGATRLTLAAPKTPGPALGEAQGGDALTDIELERELVIQADLYHNKDVLTSRKTLVKIGGTTGREDRR